MFFGYFVAFLLNFFLLKSMNKKSSSSSTKTDPQPSKYTDSNVNQIGSAIPVVLGRAMIKNPLVSYYGDFSSRPYTEEYGMHTELDAADAFEKFIYILIGSLVVPNTVVTNTGGGEEVTQGAKNAAMMYALVNILTSFLLQLFTKHEGRTTIQKGFLYYLGWQHILCWSGPKIGIRKIWMNVYDSNVEANTMAGVWAGNVATFEANPGGVTAHIEDYEMFGGPDEGGGFSGDVRLYFGGYVQALDPWMVSQMSSSPNIPAVLKGKTPLYPMYFTCVIPKAYIGKQATIPEMWFEVVNYSNSLQLITGVKRQQLFNERLVWYFIPVQQYISEQDPSIQAWMQPFLDTIRENGLSYINTGNPPIEQLQADVDNAINNCPPVIKDGFISVMDPLHGLVHHRVWALGQLGEDLNPAEAIYEILTNTTWGCHYDPNRINIDSLVDLGIRCEEENLGISILMNSAAQAKDFIDNILMHINGVHFDDPKSGKLTFRLIRNNFDINEIKSFDVSNCPSCEFSRLDWSEVISTLSVKFTDASNKYTSSEIMVYDLANRIITGSYTENQVDGTYFTTPANARWLAQTQLMSAGYPLAMVNLECNRYGYDILIGDPILVNWEPYGISKQVFRVIDVDYATLTNGVIKISAVEDVFSFDKTDYEFSNAPAWTDPEKEPFDIARYLYYEEPYELSYSLNTSVYAFAAKPSVETVQWNIWRLVNGSYNKTVSSNTWSMVGRMIYGYQEEYEFDPTGFEFGYVGVDGREKIDIKKELIDANPYTYNSSSKLNLLVVDNEIMAYDKIVELPNGNYQLQGVVRGVFDTIPKPHTAESIMYFFDYALNIVDGGYGIVAHEGDYANEQIELKTASLDVEQPFDMLDIEVFDTTRRSEQPSIMANLKFGADKGTETVYNYSYLPSAIFSYDILFTFIGRNKFKNKDILVQTDDTTPIDVADDTQNVIKVACNGEEFEYKWDARDTATSTNITDMRLKWSDFCTSMGNKVSTSNTVSLTIKTYDKTRDLYSYDEYHKVIRYDMPRFAGVVTSASDVQAYANTLVQPSLNSIVLPATSVSPALTLTYNDCVLIFVGSPTSTGGIVGQDGNIYKLSNEAYRIDGYDSDGNAIIHAIDVDENFIIISNYTVLVGNYSNCFRYYNGDFIYYTPYQS